MRRNAVKLSLLLAVLFLGGFSVWQWREARPADTQAVIDAAWHAEPPHGKSEHDWSPWPMRLGHWEYTVDHHGDEYLLPRMIRRRPVTTFARLREWLGADEP